MRKIGLSIFLGLLVFITQGQEPIIYNDLAGKGYYLDTKWGRSYYEVFGEGDPLIILHGNGGSAKSKRHMAAQFADDQMVIMLDSRCHGKSTCPEEDLDYFELAEDAYRLMEHLGYEKYMIWGHSDGGILGLILGYTHTDKIDRMVLSGANAYIGGLEPELVKFISDYEKVKDPALRKQVKLMYDQRPIPMHELRKVNVPVLLMVGDRDAVLLAHTVEMFHTLPMAQLCVLPGTTHFIENEKKDQLVFWVNEFRKPFSTPSTLSVVERVAQSLFGDQ